MAPMSRYRSDDNHVPTPAMAAYYSQRACVPGTLIIAEASSISRNQVSAPNVPAIYSEEQIAGWREVTDAVHAHGSFIICQLLAPGRAVDPVIAARERVDIMSASAIRQDAEHAVPKAMTVEDIQQTVREFVEAAKNAIRAGFDGVEIHGAYGYLLDQFLQDTCNFRDDEYGGSIERRSRFAVEVVRAVAEAIGPERTALRLSPWSRVQGMRMADPIPQFSHLIREIASVGSLAYLHFINSRVHAFEDIDAPAEEGLDFAFKLWDGPILVAGGYDAESAKRFVDQEAAARDNVVVVIGRHFTSNPDLVFRVREGVPFAPYKREWFYKPETLQGFADFPFSDEFLQAGRGTIIELNHATHQRS
ncbi:FMN-linked oxidoreductase [Aspergillus pseudoustus]|uniref:FMN-linked oxidoreductase n=1 Tax=Aspergillus pseudoustus TaxID=1810923 RepID=A0ABR4KAU4_9EURO